MGFLAGLPWGKIAVGVGGSLLGNWLGGRAKRSAMERSPEELAALRGATGAAGDLSRQGQGLTHMGLPAVGGASNYWQTLLGGNRAAMAQATAGPRAALTDQYRGAERGLERSGLRGATRDLASANLSRDRASRIAGLTTGVQPMAAEQLGNLGLGLTGQGTAALMGTGNIWSSLLREAAANRYQGNQAGQQTSSQVGGLIWDILAGSSGSAAGAGAAGTTSTAAFDPITGAKFTDVEPKAGGDHWWNFWRKLFGRGGGGSSGRDQDWVNWFRHLSNINQGAAGRDPRAGGPI